MLKRVIIVAVLVSLCVIIVSCTGKQRIKLTSNPGEIRILIDGTETVCFRYHDELSKPVLYPVKTLSGITVTRHYPFDEVDGESNDHPHHTGVFFTYDEVNDNRFWANTGTSPQIKCISVKERIQGKSQGIIDAVSHWIAEDGSIVLEENRRMVFTAGQDEYAIDFSITLTAVDAPVMFQDTKEGMFAIRVAPWLKENGGTGKYLSARNGKSANDIWGKRAEWVRLEGDSTSGSAGVAIMNHPASVNYPTFWHARDYGLFSANPLGQSVFQEGTGHPDPLKFELTLKKDEQAHFRFCLLVYDGSHDSAAMNERFDTYRMQ